jgi:pimeloyl-ACP methyl ester carboxylesterase
MCYSSSVTTTTKTSDRRVGRIALIITLALVGGCAAPSRFATAKADTMAAFEADVASGSATLHVWVRGGSSRSDVLVLINGGPGLSHESMDAVQAALATPTLRVVMYDQRGVGRSHVDGTEPFKPADYLDDLDAIRTFFGAERIHILGHSFGAMIALSYFDRQPERVASLVLVSPGVSDAAAMMQSGELLSKRIVALQHDGVIPDPIPTGCRARILALLPAYFADPHRPIPDELKQRECDDSKRSDVLFDFIKTPYHHGVGSVSVPALVVYGEREPFGPEPSRVAAALLRPAPVKLVELKACGHLAWFECRDAFMNVVVPFVAASER